MLFQAGSGVFSKYAALQSGHSITNVFFVAALVLLVLQAITWQQALINYPLCYAFPFMSATNFVVLVASAFLFNETITIYNIIGLLLISGGIMLLCRSDACE